ncbi:hypothetical protein VNO77_44157 [Canavalia gladiata]|uniref:PB1-like domain-containing protein n=1 Tax=Canavalia gladiata TaxID=3824 RepID=A0AAN9PQ43_CANGL
MGKFVKEPSLQYKGGEVYVCHDLDAGKWSYFEALALMKDLGYKDIVKIWWKSKRKRIDKWLKELSSNKDVVELIAYAEEQNCEMEIYVEHVISIAEPAMEKKFDAINDSINDVHFEDIKEERDTGVDDGFNLNEIGEVKTTLNEKIQNMKIKKMCEHKTHGPPHLKKQNPRKNVKKKIHLVVYKGFVEKDNIVNDQGVNNSKDVDAEGNSIDAHRVRETFILEHVTSMHHID